MSERGHVHCYHQNGYLQAEYIPLQVCHAKSCMVGEAMILGIQSWQNVQVFAFCPYIPNTCVTTTLGMKDLT